MDESASNKPQAVESHETEARAAEAAVALQEEAVLMAQEERHQLEQRRFERRVLLPILLVLMTMAVVLAISAGVAQGAMAAGAAASGIGAILRSQRAAGPEP